jgi:hypothetical protein
MKKPEIKIPTFLSDLLSDLRDRRLLPLVGVLAVAIVAVPFALSKSSTPTSPGPAGASGAPADDLTIVAANPGLRDYKLRLRGDKAKDPFTQQYTGVANNASSEAGVPGTGPGSGGSGASGSVFGGAGDTATVGGMPIPGDTGSGGSADDGSGDSGSSGGSNGGGEPTPPTPPDNGGGDEPQPAWVVSLRVGAPGDTNLRELSAPQGLPSDDNPIVVFRGLSPDGHKARFGVSESVSAIFGDATCVKGTDRCEVVEIQRDSPVNFVYGPADKVYRVTVVQIQHND